MKTYEKLNWASKIIVVFSSLLLLSKVFFGLEYGFMFETILIVLWWIGFIGWAISFYWRILVTITRKKDDKK